MKKIRFILLLLARKTGGSIHTMEDDLFKLVEVNEGQVIEIEGANYKLIKGNFVKLEEN